jgi:hypothetical protein
MNAINDGGPAFPTTATATTVSKQNDGDSVLTNYGSSPGMSLRVWLAGQALQGWAAGRNHSMTETSDHDTVAKACLQYADAIIRAAQEVKP